MPQSTRKTNSRLEVCILAGGLSSRMGRDKARVKMNGQAMLACVRGVAARLGLPVRVIRRDIVPRCGPLGGVITSFHRSGADALLFLACDMPFVTPALLRKVLDASQQGDCAVFATSRNRSGFPFVLPRKDLGAVMRQRAKKQFSLQSLADAVGAKKTRVAANAVFNINTPDDLVRARARNSRKPAK